MEKKLNSNHLKMIAIIAMTIDHATDLIYPGFPANPAAIFLHIIGRLTAPIMWFFVCEGYHYTRNIKKYMLRLLVFAIISHFAYCFAFGINVIPFSDGIFNQTSVVYPLLKQYNGQRGKAKWTKWLFYIYYPAHLVIVGILRIALYGDIPLLF